MQPLPDVNEALLAPFWQGLRAGQLLVQRCASCAQLQWPPTTRCASCWSAELAWEPQAQAGTVWSFAVYHRAFHPGFADRVPYAVALVDLDNGPQLPGLVVEPRSELCIGARVVAAFEALTDDVTLLRWRLS